MSPSALMLDEVSVVGVWTDDCELPSEVPTAPLLMSLLVADSAGDGWLSAVSLTALAAVMVLAGNVERWTNLGIGKADAGGALSLNPSPA